MKILIKDAWKLENEEVIKLNEKIKEKLKDISLNEFCIYGKKVYNFNIRYNESLGLIIEYNLRKRKADNFKYYCRGNFLIEENKIISISDFNYNLIKENEIFSIKV